MTQADQPCMIVITAPDPVWMAQFARALVDAHLCAAVHCVDEVSTTYRWRGEVHQGVEARATLHTRMGLIDLIADRVNDEHPYEVPCVAALPIIGGNPAYLRWIIEQTQL
jgi:periplasmic divalent cation tolerance protein